jgi:hypothetical protein
MTYLIVTPYLKGLHLTLASYHPGRNKFGWKMGSKEWSAYLFEAIESGKLTDEEAATMSPLKGRGAFLPTKTKRSKTSPPPSD